MNYPKRLIEVDLPISRISAHARREKSIRHGHISTLHTWWARRPLASCRAVILASLWPDPVDLATWQQQAGSSQEVHAPRTEDAEPSEGVDIQPARFLDEARSQMNRWSRIGVSKGKHADGATLDRLIKIQSNPKLLDDPEFLRTILLDFIADFANWDNSTDADYLATSRALVQAAHETLGGELGSRPRVIDPFAGGGSIPLEALRVGADAFASDLNPIPVLLNKVVLEYIPKYGQRLADQVHKWGRCVKEQAEQELAELYPKDPDGSTPIAYLWARTILSEAPGQGTLPIEVPLLRTLSLSKVQGRERVIRWLRDGDGRVKTKRVDVVYRIDGVDTPLRVKRPLFEIVEPTCDSRVESGTVTEGSATCPVTGFTTKAPAVKVQLSRTAGGKHSARLYGVYLDSPSGRYFRVATSADARAIESSKNQLRVLVDRGSDSVPTELINPIRPYKNTRGMSAVTRIGCSQFAHLYNDRQLLAINSFFGTVRGISLDDPEFSEAVQTLLALAVSRAVYQNTTMSRWDATRLTIKGAFSKQALAVVWDYAEANPFSGASADWDGAVDWVCKVILANLDLPQVGNVAMRPACLQGMPSDSMDALVTDPPYFAAIPYGDLSDFFYVWLRRHLKSLHPGLFAEDVTEKTEELIVTNGQVGPTGETKDGNFFRRGMTKALVAAREEVKPSGLGVVVYAEGTTSGWEAVIGAILDAGWSVTASWPIDTEMENRTRAQGKASLQSSVHIVCRPREHADGVLQETSVGEWREVLAELPKRLAEWMPRLAEEGVVGADAIFACIGPALEIFSRYSRVERASGEQVSLIDYLEQIWAAVANEALSMIFKDADAAGLEPDARLTAMWLWTVSGSKPQDDGDDEPEDENDEESIRKKVKSAGFRLEFDAARKIAQGLGIHLEKSTDIVEVKGDSAYLLSVAERIRHLFGKDATEESAGRGHRKKRAEQRSLFVELDAIESAAESGGNGQFGGIDTAKPDATVLDTVHQSMVLFASGRSEALRRFLVDDGIGKDAKFWKLAQALSALYPNGTDEKRWVDGVLARKKGLGL